MYLFWCFQCFPEVQVISPHPAINFRKEFWMGEPFHRMLPAAQTALIICNNANSSRLMSLENIWTVESAPLVLLTSLPTFPESHVTNPAGRQAHRVTSCKFPSLYEGHCPLCVCWTAHLPFQPPTYWECEACRADTSHLEGWTSLLKGKPSENGKEKWI